MAAAGRTYVDFVPPHSLLDEPDKVLRVDLTAEGFRKDQLRVQIDNFGRLRISGERPLRADSNRWRRFSKDFQVPEGCDAAAIRARLEKGGALLITMPRLSPPAQPAQEPKAAGGVDPQDQQKNRTSAQQETAPAAEAGEENNKEDPMERRGQDEQQRASDNSDKAAPGGRAAYGFGKSRRSIVWAIVAVMLALVGAGLYARYRLMDPSAETAPAGTHIVALSDS